MGGRGKTLGTVYKQIDMKDYNDRMAIQEIISNSKKIRQEIGSGVGIGRGSLILYKKCACCGKYTIPAFEENFLCPVCGWIDDLYQNIHPDSIDGSNKICLKEAQQKLAETYNISIVK